MVCHMINEADDYTPGKGDYGMLLYFLRICSSYISKDHQLMQGLLTGLGWMELDENGKKFFKKDIWPCLNERVIVK